MPTRIGATKTYMVERAHSKSRMGSTVVYAAVQKQAYIQIGTHTTYAAVRDYSKFLIGRAPIELLYSLINEKSSVVFTPRNSRVGNIRTEDGRTAIDLESVESPDGVMMKGVITLYYDRISMQVFKNIAALQDELPVLNSHAEFVALVNSRFGWKLSESELVDMGNWGMSRTQRAIRASQSSYFFEPGTQIVMGNPTAVLGEGVAVNQLSGWERPQ